MTPGCNAVINISMAAELWGCPKIDDHTYVIAKSAVSLRETAGYL